MTYTEAIRYLDSFINYERLDAFDYKSSMRLERMEYLLELLDNPHNKFHSIHIAGTKGKGSICAMIYSVLKEKGLKAGLYTSPHLEDWRERIRISPKLYDGEELINKEEFCNIVDEVKPKIEVFNRHTEFGAPTFFEVLTAMAFLYFAKNKIDIAVLETGLGGRLDATNVVHPLVSCISPISFDHTRLLGTTLKEIALEKAGIIKEGGIVVSSPQEPEAAESINDVCKRLHSNLYVQGKHFFTKVHSINPLYQRFDVSGIFGEYPDIQMSLLGRHQAENAATAIAALELLRDFEIHISHNDICNGFSKVNWPGRLEIIRQNPTILLDGAQNESSGIALAKAVKEIFTYHKIIGIIGMSKDKDIEGFGRALCPYLENVIVTRADNPRAIDPVLLYERFKVYNNNVIKRENLKSAIEYSLDISSNDDLIIITGSLFLVGQARQTLLIGRSARGVVSARSQ